MIGEPPSDIGAVKLTVASPSPAVALTPVGPDATGHDAHSGFPIGAEWHDVVRRVGIYGPRDYLEIVQEQLSFWRIDALEGLNAVGRAAQEKLMEIPARLERVAEAIESRTKRKTFSFELTFAREFALE